MMIDRRTVFGIHRLKNSGLSERQIAAHLNISRETVSEYLTNPEKKPVKRTMSSIPDPYREQIRDMVKEYPFIKAPVVLRRIREDGFTGRITIVRDYLRELKKEAAGRKAFMRFESEPGRQMQIDWGHFGSIVYPNGRRKLYGLSVIESRSRMLHVTFTHSQCRQALHQALTGAFRFFGGSPKEIVFDNMMTAVTERIGGYIRFNGAFPDFLRPSGIVPRACNVRAPHEKGRVESSIKYLRHSFFPLRTFGTLRDVQAQVIGRLCEVANVRVHQGTGQKPAERFQKDALRPLPAFLPDCRQTGMLPVHKDFGVRFDGNVYTVPPWSVGKKPVVKADTDTVSLYHKDRRIAVHARCRDRRQRIELSAHPEQVKRLKKHLFRDRQIVVFLSLGQIAADYLKRLSESGRPIRKTVARLLLLKDAYGADSLLRAMERAMTLNIFGADYIENILHQETTPKREHPPLHLKNPTLNEIRLTRPSLAEYDLIAFKQRRNRD